MYNILIKPTFYQTVYTAQTQLESFSYLIKTTSTMNFIKTAQFISCQQALKGIFRENNVDQSHGLGHAMKVTTHAVKAILSIQNKNISQQFQQDIIYASLLHDADDKKYFPFNMKYDNAKFILKKHSIDQNRINNIVKMIDLVSFSKNGDNINQNIDEAYYIPRYSDRLQAIGLVGLVRCYDYSQHNKRALFTANTIKPKNISQLWSLSMGRDKLYMDRGGLSDSFIDHIYDKLIHLKIPIKNPYLEECYSKCLNDIIAFSLESAKNNYEGIQTTIKRIKGVLQTNELLNKENGNLQ